MGLGYWKIDNIYLLVLFYKCHKNMFLCLNIYFGGQAIQWIPFQNCIYDGHLEIQDGRPGTFDFIYLFIKYHWKVFNCEVEINVLKLRVAKII